MVYENVLPSGTLLWNKEVTPDSHTSIKTITLLNASKNLSNIGSDLAFDIAYNIKYQHEIINVSKTKLLNGVDLTNSIATVIIHAKMIEETNQLKLDFKIGSSGLFKITVL